ncbi:MAG: hypothetical protein J6C25_11730 [Treponema sp.]|nr:hypothetical protein [Treponema sp.]MBO5483192.1 hypothetical protein [Spirochaetaceae bacterium]
MFNGLKKKASVSEMSEMYGLFSEISEDEMMSVNGGCGGASGCGGKTIGGVSFNGQGVGQVSGSNAKAISNACTYVGICIAGPLSALGAAGLVGSAVSKIASGISFASTVIGGNQGGKD